MIRWANPKRRMLFEASAAGRERGRSGGEKRVAQVERRAIGAQEHRSRGLAESGGLGVLKDNREGWWFSAVWRETRESKAR